MSVDESSGSEQPLADSAVTPHISRWIGDRVGSRGASFTAGDRAMARLALLDEVGCMIAGSRGPSPQATLCSVISTGAGFPSTLVGFGTNASVRDAAMINAASANELELDDLMTPFGHIGTMVVPAALAVGEAYRRSGTELLEGIALGYELSKFVSSLTRSGLRQQALDAIAHFGMFGALSSAAYLCRLDEDRVEVALGILGAIGATMPGGSYGTDAHVYQTGMAVSLGVTAAVLAGRGFTAPPAGSPLPARGMSVLDAPNGQIGSHLGDHSESTIVKRLDAAGFGRWPANDPPVPVVMALERLHAGKFAASRNADNQTIKPYPASGDNHAAIDAALELRSRLSGDVTQIERVEVEVPQVFMSIEGRFATTAREARYSRPVLLAMAIVDGKVTLSQMTDESVCRPVIQTLARKVTTTVSDRLTAMFDEQWGGTVPPLMPTSVTVVTPNGSLRSDIVGTRGSPRNPLSYDEVVAKFTDCARYGGFSSGEIDRALSLIEGVEEIEDVSALLDAVRGAAA